MFPSRSRHARRARPRLLALELRLTPATASLVSGVLTVNYTASGTTAEKVTVANEGTYITLTGNITGSEFLTANVNKIVIQDLGGSSAQSLSLSGSTHFELKAGFSSSGVETVGVNQPIVASGAAISISAPGSITLNAGLNTAGGELTLAADSDADGVGTLTVAGAATAGWTTQAHLAVNDGLANDGLGNSSALSADGNTAIIGANLANVNGRTDQGAAYVFSRSGSVWTLQQKLLAAVNTTGAQFGYSVAISADGNTAVVGAPNESKSSVGFVGAVWVYTRQSGLWSLQSRLDPDEFESQQFFGQSVAVAADGSRVLVGAPGTLVDNLPGHGRAYVYSRTGGVWSAPTHIDKPVGAEYDRFGFAIDLSNDGNTAAITTNESAVKHSVYIFNRVGAAWEFQTKLLSDEFGGGELQISLSGDGDTLAVGDRFGDIGANGLKYGEVTLFRRNADSWSQQQVLTVDEGDTGRGFGASVDLSSEGNSLIVTQFAFKGATSYVRGSAAYAYARQGNTWALVQKFVDPTGADEDMFGKSVALSADGRTALVGAPNHHGPTMAGVGWGAVFTAPGADMNTARVASLTGAAIDLISPIHGGLVLLGPSEVNRPISLGSATGGALSLSNSQLAQVHAPLHIGNAQSGPLAVAKSFTRSDVFAVTLQSGSMLSIQDVISTQGGSVTLAAKTVNSSTTGVIYTRGGLLTISTTGLGDQTLAGALNSDPNVSGAAYRGAVIVRSAPAQVTYLTSANSDIGLLQIDSASHVVVNGAFGQKNEVRVSGILSGTGVVGPVTVLAGGTIDAGDGLAGKLTVGDLALSAAATYSVRIARDAWGQVKATNSYRASELNYATLSGTVALAPAPSQIMTIIDNFTSVMINGTFNSQPEGSLATIGGRAFLISYKGGDGNDVTLQALPGVSSVVFGDGTNQRSMVKRLVVNFSEPVSFVGPVVDAFTLTRTGTGGTTGDVVLAANPISGPASSVTITFSGDQTEFGSLVDGFYNLTIDATKMTNPYFDGDADGQPGGNYSVLGNTTNRFFRLFGDIDGNGTVDFTDFAAFRTASGSVSGQLNYNAAFDFEGDGDVDLGDFIRFRQRFGMTP